MKVEFRVDSRGFRRADPEHPYEPLGAFLEQDVQSSVNSCDELLGLIREAESARGELDCGTWNAHSIYLSSSGVRIENEFAPDCRCQLSLEDFRQAVLGWREFISSTSS
jgi:hypothetical protein